MRLVKYFLRWLLMALYKVEVKGIENLAAAGQRVLIVANHTSFLDAVLLAMFLPDDMTYAVNTQVAQRRLFKPFFRLTRFKLKQY